MTTETKEEVRYGDGADVGDILHASWGYDQTNASWFRVERRTEKTVWLVELNGRLVNGEEGFMTGRSVPTDEVHGRGNDDSRKPFRRKVGTGYRGGIVVRITSYMYAEPWDGKPKRVSWYA